MRIAIVGCGYVASLYMHTLPFHPDLELSGVHDSDPDRARRFSAFYKVPAHDSLEALLADPRIELVLNLTNPRSHAAVTRACLLAGKHVYSEKPLAMTFEEAESLVQLAEERGLLLSGAPSRLLGDTAQTMWKALREDAIGRPRLVYAEMDDGMLHKMNFRNWITPTGVSWPVKDELETGCTVEHAGYSLTWLVGFFGPVESVTAFSTVLVPDKEVGFPIDQMAADFSVGVLRFVSGVVGRITTSIFATHNHAIRVFGDRGTLSIDDCWKPRTPVHLQRRVSFAGRSAELPWRSEVSLVGDPELRRRTPKRLKKVDFCLGPLDMVAALRERRSPRLSARYVLHVAELVLAIHNARENGVSVKLRSRFDPVDPMPWAR